MLRGLCTDPPPEGTEPAAECGELRPPSRVLEAATRLRVGLLEPGQRCGKAGMDLSPSKTRGWFLCPPVQVPLQARRQILRSILEAA